jgi:hypothetical protein
VSQSMQLPHVPLRAPVIQNNSLEEPGLEDGTPLALSQGKHNNGKVAVSWFSNSQPWRRDWCVCC